MIICKSGKRILEIMIATMILLCLIPAMKVNAESISVEPTSLTLAAGKTATVYASVTGSGSYSYSWSSEGGVVSVTGNGAKATVRGLESGSGKVKVSVSKTTIVTRMVRKSDGSYGYQNVTETTSVGSRNIYVTVTGSSGSGSGSGSGGTVVTHNWVAGNIISEPTCGVNGSRRYYCTKCNATKTVAIPATGAHVYDDGIVLTEPSCGSGGLKKYTCTVCGNYYTETIAATGEHTFGEPVVTREPNCKYEGSGIQTCSVCGKEETVTIPTNDKHDYQFDTIVKEGNCTEKGIRRDYCQYCFKTRESELALNPDYHAEILLGQEEYSANVGDTIQLEPTLSEDHCSSEFTYESSDESVASVSEEGLITVLSYGAAQITVQNAHGQKAFCTVHTPMPEQFTSTGSSSFTNTLPFGTQDYYSTTQTIYTPALLTHAGTISRIAYYVGNMSSYKTDEVRIYMEKTSRGSYNSGSDFVCSAPVLVYTGSPILGSKQGWETFVLDTPFEYDGSSNIVVTVVRKTANWASSALYYSWQPKDQNMSISRSSRTDITYAMITNNQGFKLQAYIPSTRFTMENDAAGYCAEKGHDYSEPQVKKANCYFNGYTWRYCKRCGHVEKTDKEYSSYHDWDVFDKKEATCTEPGYESYLKCRNCAFSTYAEIPPIDHTAEIDEAVSPDCTHTGLTAGTHCKVCSAILTPQEEIPALGHTPVRSEAKDASCEEPGMTEGEYCSVCGEILTQPELIPAEHKMATLDAVEADCTHEGMTEGSYCSVCGMIEVEQEVTPALGHNLSKHEAREASCTDVGWDEYETCTRCDYSTYNELPALGHDPVHHEAQAPTCTDVGWEAYETCSRCDYTTYNELPALGHDPVHHEAQAPTCTEIGWDAYDTCSRCEYTTYKELDALGHDLEHHDAEAATCEADGTVEYWHCSTCSKDYSDEAGTTVATSLVDPKKDHKMTHHPAEAATCEADGTIEYWSCSKCNKNYSDAAGTTEVTDLVDGLKTGHTFPLTHYNADPDNCTIEYWECSKCRNKFSDENADNRIESTIDNDLYNAKKEAAKPKTKPEKIDLKAVKGLKVKGAKGKLTVKWKKAANKELKTFQGYEIQYTANGTFTDYQAKKVGKKKASVTLKKLLKKKKYTVRIRRYRDDGSVLHVSNWTVKKTKTK